MLRFSPGGLWKFQKPIRPIEFYDRLLNAKDPIPKNIEFTQSGIATSCFSSSANSSQILPNSPLIGQILSLEHAPARSLLTYNIQVAVRAFQRHETDCASPEVQIAVLTVKIAHLKEHFLDRREARKDFRAQRLLIEMMHQRVRSLKHLKRLSLERYFKLVKDLKLSEQEVAFGTEMIPEMLSKRKNG